MTTRFWDNVFGTTYPEGTGPDVVKRARIRGPSQEQIYAKIQPRRGNSSVSFCAARSINEVTFYVIDVETMKRVALEQRKAIARKAVRARWHKAKKS